jgi:hypothetical protein
MKEGRNKEQRDGRKERINNREINTWRESFRRF